MKVNHIDTITGNLDFKTFNIKLPKKRKDLEEILLDNNTIEKGEEIKVEHFNNTFISVKDIEIKNFKIKATTKNTTNIFYLNVYFEILKSKNLDVPEEEIEIDTIVLKEMISDLLNANNKNIDIEEIYKIINCSEDKEEQNEEEKIELETNSDENKVKERPVFSIKKLQQRRMERKERESGK